MSIAFATDAAISSIAVALGVGLLIGIERERRKGEGPNRASAGVRTFALAAIVGAVSMLSGSLVVVAIGGAGIVMLTAISYLKSRDEDPGLTTEVALIATFMVGVLAVLRPLLAAGVGAAVALLLASRSVLHGFARRQLSESEVRDGILLAAAALIILPALPDHPIDPWGAINPRLVWQLTIVVMIIIAAGYVLQRVVGARWGLPLAGLLGGFASSTATIASMGQRVRNDETVVKSAVAGATLSSVPTVLQLALVLSVANLSILRSLAFPLVAMATVAAVYGAYFTFHAVAAPDGDRATQVSGRAFSPGTAVLFAAVFCAIAVLVALLQRAFGDAGALVGAVTGGFLDAHSSSASVAGLAAQNVLSHPVAGNAIGLILTANTLAKLVFARVGGSLFFWRVAPGLVLMIAAFWFARWVLPG
jgi:uncharacterized membrane protein (DUF4010 family)